MDYDHLQTICGKFRGIQGHHNSCYLDATLFSMFAFSRVCDAVLYRPANDASDIGEYGDIQRVLRDEIVNPLRISQFVRADRVLGLRRMLESVCSAQGLTTEEKDPEEFLNILLAQALKASPFLRLSSGQAAFCYQLFVDRDERLQFPSVQQLFDQSFLSSNIKLQSVPNCLIVQMPRFGKDYKTYPRILPSLVLDVTDVIENCECFCSVVFRIVSHSYLIRFTWQLRVPATFVAVWPNWNAKTASSTTPRSTRSHSVACAFPHSSSTKSQPTVRINRSNFT